MPKPYKWLLVSQFSKFRGWHGIINHLPTAPSEPIIIAQPIEQIKLTQLTINYKVLESRRVPFPGQHTAIMGVTSIIIDQISGSKLIGTKPTSFIVHSILFCYLSCY